MANQKLADLTIDEFRALVRETVIETLSEFLGDPDEGLQLRDEFVEELRYSLGTAGEAIDCSGKEFLSSE